MNLEKLHISLIQTSLFWENPTANRAMLEEKICSIASPTDIIVLPEMFTTGFSMNAHLAEPMNFTSFRWLKQMATYTQAVLVGSYMVYEKKQYFNRLFWVEPTGEFDTYDKRHLFRMIGEDQQFKAGNTKIIKHLKGWNICPLICYDLRFPVWSRNITLEYDLLLYIANWPQERSRAWNTLLQARAIENLSYVAGLNIVGNDGNNVLYAGGSMVVNFDGGCLIQPSDKEAVFTVEVSKNDLQKFREKFPANLDADIFKL